MKYFPIIVFFTVFNALANPLCEGTIGVKGAIYSSFMSSSQNLQYGFPHYYQLVSKSVNEAYFEVCKGKPSVQDISNAMQTACIKTCDEKAFNHFNGLLENTQKKQKVLFNECSAICNSTITTIHMMGLAMEDSRCQSGKAILNVNDSENVKEVLDKIKKSNSNSEASKQ